MEPTVIHQKWEFKKFFQGFALWILCIPINFVPIIMVYINRIEADELNTAKELMRAVFNDIDFIFVFIAVLFVLPLQGLFADYCDEKKQNIGKWCSVVCYITSTIMLLIYILCSANPNAHKLLYANVSHLYSIVISILTIAAGVAIHVIIAYRQYGTGGVDK